MAKAKKLPSGQWRTLVYSHTEKINGKDKRIYESFTADTKKESEYLAAEFSLNRKRIKVQKITFEEAATAYINDKDNVLSPATVRGYDYMLRNCFESIKYLPIKKIDETVIQQLANTNAKHYSAKSISNQLGFISAVLKKYKIKIDFDDITKKPKEKKEIIIPTEKEVKMLLEASKNTNIEIPIILAALCGLRQSEIAACTWDKVNGNILKVKGAIVPNRENKLTNKATNKSYSGTRDIILIDYAAERLSILKGNKKEGTMSTMIPSSVLRALKHLCRSLHIPEYTMHSLRHYHASVMLSINIPDKYAMKILGQNSPYMLKTTYQHIFSEEYLKVNAKINDHYSDLS
nr:MAG TPA: Integrase [Caudoviricetes sp.]